LHTSKHGGRRRDFGVQPQLRDEAEIDVRAVHERVADLERAPGAADAPRQDDVQCTRVHRIGRRRDAIPSARITSEMPPPTAWNRDLGFEPRSDAATRDGDAATRQHVERERRVAGGGGGMCGLHGCELPALRLEAHGTQSDRRQARVDVTQNDAIRTRSQHVIQAQRELERRAPKDLMRRTGSIAPRLEIRAVDETPALGIAPGE
jgi:hypothetical protein